MGEAEFPGFPAEGLKFLAELADNNNREWFQAHKQDYIDHAQTPALDFVIMMGARLQTLSEGMVYDTRTNGSGSLMRIYRDIRFSKDKTPYKTNLGITFWEGAGGKLERPNFFFELSLEGAMIYCGVYRFSRSMLAAYRDAVADDRSGADLEASLASLAGAGDYRVGGEHYKRVPAGYDPAHRRADLLRYNCLYACPPMIDPGVITSPEFLDVCFAHCRAMMPLHRWLVGVDQMAAGG
jgi:uncharacterized protein (TIGR02453 family)